ALLHNHYGPSESHVITAHALGPDADAWAALPAIGRPISNAQIYLIDAKMRPVAVGLAGELYAGGCCLARGYINRSEQTAEKFVPNRFGEFGGRLYNTGDMARCLPDGNIEFIGRGDQQVKIRGYRVELKEIEAILAQHPGVSDSAVVARQDTPRSTRIVAYVMSAPGEKPSSADLRRHLKERIPTYMIPSAFVLMDRLPLTPNGKVDRLAFQPPENPVEIAWDSVAPRTPAEELVARLWSEVLSVKKVGICNNFFELGGHSLAAARLVVRL